jgi:hypothetical protein
MSRLVEPWIDLRQHVTLADVLAFLEQDLLELAVDLRTNAHRERCLHRAEPGQVDRHVALRHFTHGHGDGAAAASSRRLYRLRAFDHIPHAGAGESDRDSGDDKRAMSGHLEQPLSSVPGHNSRDLSLS